MNVLKPIHTIMTKDVITVHPTATLSGVKDIFDRYNIHHLPVVDGKELVGMISKSDFLYFLHGFQKNLYERLKERERLGEYKAAELMVRGLAKLDENDPIRAALEVFNMNLFHALPITRGEDLVGILTTFDIIKALSEEPTPLEDYKEKVG